jgi:hypothetical protein
MRKRLLPIFLLLASAWTITAQESPKHYVDTNVGFSFDLPQGWGINEMPNAKYKVAFGQRENGFTPNISVEDDSCPCPLAEYVDLAQRHVEMSYKDLGLDSIKFQNKREFTTLSGLKGWKVTNIGTRKNLSVVFRQYVFEGKDKGQLIFTCAASVESASKSESACDGAMKTLSLTK